MSKPLAALAVLALTTCSLAQARDITVMLDHLVPLKGSGTMKTETRELSGFDSIQLKGATDIDVQAGGNSSVSITADDNLLSAISTQVQGHTLVIDSRQSYRTQTSPRLSITLPTLKSLEIHGSGNAQIRGCSGDALHLAIAGSGDITARGSVDTLEMQIDGSGDIDAGQLDAHSVQVEINGSGDAHVAASQALQATINGSGDVAYRGNPSKLLKTVHGSGDVEKE